MTQASPERHPDVRDRIAEPCDFESYATRRHGSTNESWTDQDHPESRPALKAVIVPEPTVSSIVLSGVVPAEVLVELRARIAQGRFVSGRQTAVGGAVSVKRNLYLALGDPAERSAVDLLAGVLQAHPLFQAAAWPDAMMRPMFCRYQAGMGYGDHLDAAIMGEAPDLVRCDIAVTVCLNDGKEYEGGELVIDTAGLPYSWKGQAGDAILYPADTLHRVADVTSGARDVAVIWVQSLVREPARRRILFDLKLALDDLELQSAPNSPPVEAVRRSYLNLIRMWV